MTLEAMLALFVAAHPVEVRPTLATVLSSFRDKSYACTLKSPEGYVQWCRLSLYPRPSVHLGLGCDGPLVNGLTLQLTPVGDTPILEVPEEMSQAIEDPSLNLPAGVATWLHECVAAVGGGAKKSAQLRLERTVLRCLGTPQAPGVSIDFLTQEGKRFIGGRKCQT